MISGREMEGGITPETPVVSMLRQRPMSMALLESSGLDPWRIPTAPIAELCHWYGVPWERFQEALAGLPVPEGGDDWRRYPIYRLLDYLVRENHQLRQWHLPANRRILEFEIWKFKFSEGGWQRMAQEWTEWVSVLAAFMDEEEGFLFPIILRQYSALRNCGVDPYFGHGSVRKFVAVQLIKHENRLKSRLERLPLLMPASRLAGEKAGDLAKSFSTVLDSVREHCALEAGFLFPMAAELEKALFDREIDRSGDVKRSATGPSGGLSPATPASWAWKPELKGEQS